MKVAHSAPLPLVPLLRSYLDAGLATGAELCRLPQLGPRFRAVLDAAQGLLREAFVDSASEVAFQESLLQFYEACVRPPLHRQTLLRRGGVVRHALGHLLRGRPSLLSKAAAFLTPQGPYHVAGLGPAFWSALLQALEPTQLPGWTPAVLLGVERLGLARLLRQQDTATGYVTLAGVYGQILQRQPHLSALHLDHFFTLVAQQRGRDLWAGAGRSLLDVAALIRQERARVPLRQRLKDRGAILQAARQQLTDALAEADGQRVAAALALVDAVAVRRAPIAWASCGAALREWGLRLIEADDPTEVLDDFWCCEPIAGAGLWLPTALLHVQDARRFAAWDETARRGYAALSDADDPTIPAAERYRLFNEALAWLRGHHRLHPLEAPAVLAACAAEWAAVTGAERGDGAGRFGGFCADTFRFLRELAANNRRAWIHGQRPRYRYAVREPLIELCRALAQRYVEPVLRRQHGWELETAARSGRALTSICKNDFGKSAPYHTEVWITFCRRSAGKRNDVQWFVRLSAAGVSYGLRIGRDAREAAKLFRRNVQEHAELLYRALCASGACGECQFGVNDDLSDARRLADAGELRAWAAGKTLIAAKHLPLDAPLLTGDDLVGDILLTFDRLLPAFVCALSTEPQELLTGRAGEGRAEGKFGDGDFRRATYLSGDWLRRARELLELKRQLILQGVPGTGKTHVARCLARLLTDGNPETVRLVQFHPAYAYEEFVEGIKARSVEVNGRHEVTYPVEEGLLCAFAARAELSPALTHVLIIDEINRGNLPRVFGELLYLLEYREQSVRLPYSRREFHLPRNLYLLGTMNAADRSVALIDQALRRRFSFLEMPPSSDVLAAWLVGHPPRVGVEFTRQVVALFERLNARLREDLGDEHQIGHSYFMVPELDEARLRVVWDHQVRPLLEEYFSAHPGRLREYDFEQLRGEAARRPRTMAGR